MKRIGKLFMAAAIAGSPAAALAGPCDAYYAFDGSLADAGGNGYDGEMVDEKGKAAQPVFVQGRNGQALKLDGSAAMRSFIDLHFDVCPRVTFTAWLQVSRETPDDTMHVLSTGRGSGPGLRISGPVLTLAGTNNGLSKYDVVRKGSGWLFVAGVYDYEAGYFQLYWGGRSTEPEKLADYRYPPENAFWIGEWTDEYGDLARGIAIDDVRIVGSALTAEQIAAHRAPASSPVPVGGSPIQLPGDHFDQTQLPGDHFDQTQLPGDHFDQTQLPGDHFDQIQLPGDHFDQIQLPGDHFDQTQLPGDHFDQTQLPGDHFDQAGESSGSDPTPEP